MSCIFESNLRNNPMHNRHILREEFGDRPFMPEDPTDGKPEEMPESEVSDDLSDMQNDIDQEKVVQIYAEKVRWPDDSDGDPDNYDEDTEDMGEETFEDAEEVYKKLVDLGVQQDMKATGSTWWQSEVEQDYTEGWEITYTIHPQSGFTQEDIDYINGRIRGDIESPDPKFSKWDRDDDYGTEGDEPQEDVVNMESCVMGSNLFGHGGYGRAILREMYEDEDGYEDPEATDDPINTEDDEAFGEPPEQDIGMETSDTIGERIANIFDGSEETINDAIDFMQTNGFNVDAPADTVDNATWKELFDYIAPTSDVDSMMNDFTGKPMMNDEDAEQAENDAANDYYEEHPEEDDSWDTDSAQLPESFELHSMLTVEGEPKYEEPEVKKEPKPKAPTLTAKRNRRLRSKTRNIQLWNNKKKCFDPKYINTRFTKMSDANEAIKRLGESVEQPLRIKGVHEIYPDYDSGVGGYDSDAAFLIDEYIGYMAKSWYTNGHIPEEEEQEIRDSLTAVLVEFEYWHDEDEDFEAGYEDGEILFIICDDGGLCGVDLMGQDFPDGVFEQARDAAYKHVGIEYTMYCGPEK